MESWPADGGQSRHRGATGLSASLGFPLTLSRGSRRPCGARRAQRRSHGYGKGLRRISAREAAGLLDTLWQDAEASPATSRTLRMRREGELIAAQAGIHAQKTGASDQLCFVEAALM